MRKRALCVAVLWIILLIAVFVLYWWREVSPLKEFIAWALSVWPLLAVLFMSAVAASGWIIRHDFGHTKKGAAPKTSLDLIIPKLQVTPVDILDDNIATTTMVLYILNCSDFLAKSISLDIKFGNSLWKHDLRKATSIDFNNKLFELKDDPLIDDILSKSSKQEQKEMHKRFLDHPLLDKLEPGMKIKVYVTDMNRGHILKGNYFFGSMGKMTPIKPEESPGYQESQGWKEQIDNTPSGEPIRIQLRTVWHNEIDKKFDQIVEYQLICTKIGTGRSYTFLPAKNGV